MHSKGTTVTVYQDPFAQTQREGNAEIVEFVEQVVPGAGQYLVHFHGDEPGFNVLRVVADADALQCCCMEHVGDNPSCKLHWLRVDNVPAQVVRMI